MIVPLSRFGALGTFASLLFAMPLLAGPSSEAEYESERPDDPPAAVGARDNLLARSPGLRVPFGPYESIQVNVDSLGRNILGDAANEPSIAVNPANPLNMAIGWRQFDSVSSNFRQAGWGYTFNGGQSWTFPGSISPGTFRSDPSLDADSQGTFYYQSLTQDLHVIVFRSTNGGVTWPGSTFEFGGDKNWLAVDRTGGPSNGYIYGMWQSGFACCGNVFTRSTNGGASFEAPVPVTKWPIFGTIAIGPDAEVYATGVDGTTGQDRTHFVVSKSTNARNPAATPTFTGSRIGLGGAMPALSLTEPNPEGLRGQGNVAVNWAPGPLRGQVYVASSVAPIGDNRPTDARLIRSTDGGATFGPSVRVNDDPSSADWQWLVAHSVSPSGRVDMVWNDTRNTGQPTLSQLFYAYSWDGGVSWSANVPVTPVFDTSVGYPNQQKLGDYNTIVSNNTGADVAFAATFNNEQDIYYVRVFPDCNANGISDVTDVANSDSADCDANHIPDECQSAPPCGLVAASSTAADACMAGGAGAGGGSVDPGEDAGLSVVVRNNGSQTMTHVAATLLTSTPGVTISQAEALLPDIPAHGTSSGQFALTAGTAIPCGSTIDLTLAATSDQGSWTRPFSLPVGAPQTAAFSQSATDVPKLLADHAITTSIMTLASNASVLDLNVNLTLLHKADGELALTLIAPNGARILLSNGEGSGGENYTNTTFDDEADAVIWTGSAPFIEGPYRPEQPLSAVDGIPANGTWALEISDVAFGNTGKLLSWSLTPTLPDGHACHACDVSAPLSSPAQVTWGANKTTLSWDPVAVASFYNVYRGTSQDLPALLTPAADSCRRAVTGATTAADLPDVPPEDSFYWYLVRAGNGAGEGPAGSATAGARSQQSTGECP